MTLHARRPVILFMAEAVTLAHLARPLVLASALNTDKYDVHFAASRFDRFIFEGTPFAKHHIGSLPSKLFQRRLEFGLPLFDLNTLREHTAEDLGLLRELQPACVIGDFRLSLSVSARVAGIPYINITNAHWSPLAALPPKAALPPLLQHLDRQCIAERIVSRIIPQIFQIHVRTMNHVRKAYGLAAYPDIRHAYTDGDCTLYADLPGFVPLANLPPTQHIIGPILWSPRITKPPWWNQIPSDRKSVYVNLGSSGYYKALPALITALSRMQVNILLGMAGQRCSPPASKNLWSAPYLPGDEAAARSDLVVCNGGSATVYQALSQGVPVLALPSNMDQLYTAQCLKRCGAGEWLRSAELTKTRAIQILVEEMLNRPTYQCAAQKISQHPFFTTATEHFSDIVNDIPFRDFARKKPPACGGASLIL